MARDQALTKEELAELRRQLAAMSLVAVKDLYHGAYYECRLDGDKIPPAKAVQRLVQAWREMRKWR